MNIRDLEYLVAVADTQHFGRAANQCFISQPTLSMQLKKLEEELNVCLFERTRQRVLVTKIGEQIVEKARCILSQIDDLKQTARLAQNPYALRVHIGIIPTIAPYFVPSLLSRVQKEYPHLALILYEDKTDIILDKLRHGSLDAVVLALPVQEKGLVSESLFVEDFYAALPASHVLATKESLVMKDLENEHLLLLGEGHCFRDQALEACRFSGAEVKRDYQATSLETLRHLVAGELGVTLLPKMMVDTLTKDKEIVILPFADSRPQRRVGILWRETSSCVKTVKAIVALLKS